MWKRPALPLTELAVRQVEGGGDAAQPGLQLAEALPVVPEAFDQVRDGPGGTRPEPGCGDPDRQWQPIAQLDHFGQQRGRHPIVPP
jgi:hypothetical protein